MRNKRLVTSGILLLLLQLGAIHSSWSIALSGNKEARRKSPHMASMHRTRRSSNNNNNNNNNGESMTNSVQESIQPPFREEMEPHPSVNMKISDVDKDRLAQIYGQTVVNDHEEDFEKANAIGMQEGADEHPIPWPGNGKDDDGGQSLVDEALLDAVNSGVSFRQATWRNSSENRGEKIEKSSLDAETVKSLLKDLLERLDTIKHEETRNTGETGDLLPFNSGQEEQHCNVHGLWLSSVAGAAIELIPQEIEAGRIEIRTRIYDLPERPEKSLITSGWSGKGMISPESPTTLTIVFQEHLPQPLVNDDKLNEEFKLPKTAVFVGQCLVCQKSPVLQGTWVVFPNAQSCMISSSVEKVPPPLSPDTFVQLTA